MSRSSEILTAKQVADYLHIHPLTVHRYAREGKIPAFKIGTDWRFHKKYIEKWIRQKTDSNLKDIKDSKENKIEDVEQKQEG